MWSMDWFAARGLARSGVPIRRVAWPRGTWLVRGAGLWAVRLPDMSWRVATHVDFGEGDFRARDWTDENYKQDVCGERPAFNAQAQTDNGWGDAPNMHPRPVPNFPEADT